MSNSVEESFSHKNVPLTHKSDLEIEDILSKLQEVTRESQIPMDLMELIENPYADNENSTQLFYSTPSLK